MAENYNVSEQNTSLSCRTSTKRKRVSEKKTPKKIIDPDKLEKFVLWIQQTMSSKIRMFLIDIYGKKKDVSETVNRIDELQGSVHRQSSLSPLSSVNQMLNLWKSHELELYSGIQKLESQVRDFTETLRTAFIGKVPILKLCKDSKTPFDTEDLKSEYLSIFRSSFEPILGVIDEESRVKVIDEVEKYKFKVISTVTFADMNITDRLFMDNWLSAELDISSQSGSSSNTRYRTRLLSKSELDELNILFHSKLDTIISASRLKVACNLSFFHGLYCVCKITLERLNRRI